MVEVINLKESLASGNSPTNGMVLSEAFSVKFDKSDMTTGFASFEAGVRQPPEGLVSREKVEISLILSGETELYTDTGTIKLKAGDLIMIPAGEANAAKALTKLEVYYMLCG